MKTPKPLTYGQRVAKITRAIRGYCKPYYEDDIACRVLDALGVKRPKGWKTRTQKADDATFEAIR